MKRYSFVFLLLLLVLVIYSEELLPNIVFIHGINGKASPDLRRNDKYGNKEGALFSWHPLKWDSLMGKYIEVDSTALLKIIGYKGYRKGSPFDCTIDSNPRDVSGNVVYNFSYYNPDGDTGVIGSGEDKNGNPLFIPATEKYQDDYLRAFKHGQWAKHVAAFIEKVYNKSGKKVYIVAHSMGGPVVRAAMTFYGAGKYVDKVITIGSPNLPFTQIDAVEDLVTNIADYQEWQEVGELLELGADVELHAGSVGFISPSEPNTVKPYLDFLYQDDTIKLSRGRIRLSTIIGARKTILTTMLSSNDGFIPCSQQSLDFAERKPVIYASHSRLKEFINVPINDTISEYAEQYSTFLVEFIKHWMIDGDSVVFTGEITDYGFGVVGNKNNPTSKSIRLIVDGEDANGNNLESYEGILCGVVTSIYEHQNSTVEVGPVKGIDFTNIINNEREPGALRGSPIYLLECPWASNAMSTMYHPKAYFYDMNGLIELPKIEHDYKFNWEDATAPYVTLLPNATALTVFTALKTYNIDWESNDISVRNRLWYARYGSVEIIDSMIPGSVMSKSFRIPPLRSRKSDGITECNLINMNLRFELDDNGYYCTSQKSIIVSTPDWNPDSLRLVYQDEDSIKLAWADRYNLVDKIKRINDGIERDIYPLNTYTDRGFIRGVDNYYEVHSRWVYPNGDSLISENDNNTHKLTVYGIPCNAPKAYPIVCIWQPNNKALIKWLDNSHQSANIKIL